MHSATVFHIYETASTVYTKGLQEVSHCQISKKIVLKPVNEIRFIVQIKV